MVKRYYKVIARFKPFDSKEEYITLKSKSEYQDIITFCLLDQAIHIDNNISEGDEVMIETPITFIKKVN